MALINTQNLSMAAGGFGGLPIARQIGILLGLAASIALGIMIVNWAQEPNYQPIVGKFDAQSSKEVVDVLQGAGIQYKINKSTGVIMVPSNKTFEAKMKLASEGLTGKSNSYDSLEKSSGFGTSQLVEVSRHRRALESELARTISNISRVKSARVHLAIPKRTAFLRDRQQPTASVFVDLYPGHTLSYSQVASIVNLVASSVPNLTDKSVTVVDQKGRLLTSGQKDDAMSLAERHFAYIQGIEQAYEKQIESILQPMLGPDKVRAQVSVDMDFTRVNQTKESFNPANAAIRSEQSMQETQGAGEGAGGVPGGASNNAAAAEKKKEEAKSVSGNTKTRSQSTKNYELEKTISHTSDQPGKIKRISVAVIVDDYSSVDGKSGKVTVRPLSEDELKKIDGLVKQAVGFNEKRGDSLSVVNSKFAVPEPVEQLPEKKIWEQDWFWSLVKQVLAGLLVLFLVFGVLRPILKSLATKSNPSDGLPAIDGEEGAALLASGDVPNVNGQGGFITQGESPKLTHNEQKAYEEKLSTVVSYAQSDSKKVAKVLNQWLAGPEE